jgi:hypothetical protein
MSSFDQQFIYSFIHSPRFVFWSRWLFFITLFTIFYLSFAPHVDVGPDFDQADKIKHAAAFSVLTLLYMLGFGGGFFKISIRMALIGVFIEVVQYFLPYRDASILDIMADSVGILAGYSIKSKGFK